MCHLLCTSKYLLKLFASWLVALEILPYPSPYTTHKSRSVEYSLDQNTSTRQRRSSVQRRCRARAGSRRHRPSPGSSSSRGVYRTSSTGSWHCRSSVTLYWGRLRKISAPLLRTLQREQNLKDRKQCMCLLRWQCFSDLYLHVHIYTTLKWIFFKIHDE